MISSIDSQEIVICLESDDVDRFQEVVSGFSVINAKIPIGSKNFPKALRSGAFLVDAAAYYGALQCLIFIINSNCTSLYHVDEHKKTLAHFGAYSGKIEIMQQVVNQNISLTDKTKSGNTVLHIAAKRGFLELCQFFWASGVPIYVLNNKQVSPVIAALANEHFDLYQFFISVGFDINTMMNSSKLILSAIKSGKRKLLFYLINNGFKQVPDHRGNYPIHEAAKKCDLDIIKLLVEKGADIDIQDENGNTPLNLAVLAGKPELVYYFIDMGADVNKKNKNGRAPIHQAAIKGNEEIVYALLDADCDYACTDNDGYTPMNVAMIRQKGNIVEIFDELGLENDELEVEDIYVSHSYSHKKFSRR